MFEANWEANTVRDRVTERASLANLDRLAEVSTATSVNDTQTIVNTGQHGDQCQQYSNNNSLYRSREHRATDISSLVN